MSLRKWMRTAAMAAITGVIASGLVGVTAIPAAAAPFNPQVPLVWLSQGVPTQLQGSEQAGGQVSFTDIGVPSPVVYNAIGFRVSDNFIYGITRPQGTPRAHLIVRVHNDGTTEQVGSIPEQPAGLIAGTFGEGALADTLIVSSSANDLLYLVNVDTGTYTTQTVTGPVTSASDITAAYGFLWGAEQNGGSIVRINPTTGVKRTFPVSLMLTDTGAYGGAWTYGNGNLAFSSNTSGLITQIGVANPGSGSPTFNLISEVRGPDSDNNDATAAPGDPTDLVVTKEATQSVEPGGAITWTVRVRNEGPGNSSGFALTDVIPAGVTNVATTDPRCTVAGLTISCAGDNLRADRNANFIFTGTAPMTPGTLVNNVSVVANEVDPTTPNEAQATTVVADAPVPHLSVTKTSNAGTAIAVGDVVTYTVNVTNDGTGAYTAGAPATLADSLADVLDDATWNNNATVTFNNGSTSAPPTLTGTTLNWSGPLKVNETASISYSVTVTNAGNNSLVNSACAPNAGEAAACDSTQNGIANVTDSKTVDPTSGTTVAAGQVLTYTLLFTNSGDAAGTIAKDDVLAEVTDDTTPPTNIQSSDPAVSAVYADGRIQVRGPIAANAPPVEITYSVTVLPDGARGDSSIANFLVAADGDPGDCTITPEDCTVNLVPNIIDSKTVNPTSGTTVTAGQVLEYTLTFDNTGTGDGTIAKDDVLTQVVDDASEPTNIVSSNPAVSAVYADGRMRIRGPIAANADPVVITYTVTVNADGARGDSRIANFLVAADADPGDCSATPGDCTVNLVPDITDSKTVDPTSGTTVAAGDVLTYTLSFVNNGSGTGTVSKDDVLTEVLDDTSDPTNIVSSNPSLEADFVGDRIEVRGSLAANGIPATITYSVTVNADGDRGNSSIANFLVAEGTDPGDCTITPEDCTINLVPDVTDSKSVVPASGTTVTAGQVLTYTLTFVNDGSGVGTIEKDDVLTQVVDDATVSPEIISSSPLVQANLVGDRIEVRGSIAPDGLPVTITYTATVNADGARGDSSIANFLVEGGADPGDCTITPEDCTVNLVPDVTDSKSVVPASGTTVTAGDVLTYTLTFVNDGSGVGTIAKDDVLTQVVDDATVSPEIVSSSPLVEANLVGDRIEVRGTIAPDGLPVTVTYTATVNADGDRGNSSIANFLVGEGAEPGDCTVTPEDCTVNLVPDITDSKTVNPVSGTTVTAGDVLTYTLSFVNNGSGTGTVSKDDVLTDVIDDTTEPTAITSSNPGLTAEFVDGRIQVRGTVAPDGVPVTVTYSVTVLADGLRGDSSIANYLVAEGAEPGDCTVTPEDCTVNLVPNITDSKSVDPASGTTVVAGQELTYTLTFVNDGSGAGAIAKDDVLTDVLDDATLTAGPTSDSAAVSAALVGDRIVVTGDIAAGQTVEVTYTVTVNDNGDRVNNSLANYLVLPGVVPVPGEECATDDCTVNLMPDLSDSKSVDPASGTPVVAGQDVTYTLTFINSGTAAGAIAKDDVLTDVLDDATLTGGPTSDSDAVDAELVGDRIVVTGDVEAGQTVEVTYTVTVNDNGDRVNNSLANYLVLPGVVPVPGEECATDDCTANPMPDLADSKSVTPASGTTVVVGQALSYTLTFSNTGTAAGAIAKEDVLTDVLDDATLSPEFVISDETALQAALVGDRIVVTGELQPGQTVTVTYTATVKPDAERGNDLLANYLVLPGVVPVPGEDCSTGDCTVNFIPRIVDSKASAPGTGTVVVTGDTITYELTFTNEGTGPGAVAKDDVLTDVLDDAELDPEIVVSDPALEAVLVGDRIRVTGALLPDQTVTVTYSVTVNDDDVRGNSRLSNYLVLPGAEPPAECGDSTDCTDHRSPRIVDTKSADPGSGTTVVAGDTLTYTLSFTNAGTAAGSVERSDSLTGVLDDADISTEIVVSDPALEATLDGDTITITGELGVNQSVTVTYSVVVRADDARGDNVLLNLLLEDGETPPTECAEGNEDCSGNPVPLITGTKAVDPESGTNVVTGQTLTYTLSFLNSGAATGTVDYTDVLADVLDDATLVEGSLVSSDPTLTPEFTGDAIRVTGPLAVDLPVTVTYQVTVSPFADRGNGQLGNFLTKTGAEPPVECGESDACTLNPIPHLSVLKTSDASPTAAIGDTITYVVTVTNDGTGDFTEETPASVTDDLSSVLDDADYNDDATATATDGSEPEVVYETPLLSWTGPLAAGDSVTITYTVTTTGAGDQNVENGVCVPNAGEDATCVAVTTGLADVSVAKSVDPRSGATLTEGESATYTITITNAGTGPGAYSYTDTLSGVLDDATITSAPAALGTGATLTPIEDGAFTAKGIIEPKSDVTVSYTVTTKAWAEQGDHVLGNFVTVTGVDPSGVCEPDDSTCTTNPVRAQLANTGTDGVALVASIGSSLLLLGLVVLLYRKRRSLLTSDLD